VEKISRHRGVRSGEFAARPQALVRTDLKDGSKPSLSSRATLPAIRGLVTNYEIKTGTVGLSFATST
jgi:hypothetical protein